MENTQRKVITPNEIYGWTPIETSKEIYHLERQFQDEIPWWSMHYEKNEKIELKYYAKQYTDGGKYLWQFFSIWYDGKPIGICERGGKDGDDHNKHYITDKQGYNEFINYLMELCEEDDKKYYDPDKSVEGMGNFHEQEIHQYYDTDFVPQYKEGDVINAHVVVEKRYGYIPYNAEYILKKVKITKVNPFNPYWTYYGYEVERHQIGKFGYGEEDTRRIVEVSSEAELTGNKLDVTLTEKLKQVK